MATKNKQNKKKKQSQTSQQRSQRPMRKAQSSQPRQTLSSLAASKWRNLLRDPCGAEMAPPCYAGADTGYLIRTVDMIHPIGTGSGFTAAGSPYYLDASFQYTPFNASASSGLLNYLPGTTAMNPTGTQNFITSTGAAKRYRPVAACMKFIPTGPYGARGGMVGSAYSAGQVEVFPDTFTPISMIPECQHVCPLGSEPHEVRWLPTAVDENFTNVNMTSNTGAGTINMILIGADWAYNSATQVTLNGYLELSTVWEWIPANLSGVNIAPRSPSPYTSQQILATIGDMGKFLFYGIDQLGRHPGLVNSLTTLAKNTVQRSIVQNVIRGPGLLM
jgi:hypothetical protein